MIWAGVFWVQNSYSYLYEGGNAVALFFGGLCSGKFFGPFWVSQLGGVYKKNLSFLPGRFLEVSNFG